MDNQYGLKAVEKQNEITEQALEPKRQFETQLDTPLTMGEYNAIADIYQNSDNKEQDILRFGQALEYKRNYGLDLDYAYNNIDALNEARGIPQEYNWSTLQSIKNSFKISALNDKLSDLNSAWMDADYSGKDKAEIEKQIADVESQIEGLQDYAPRSLVTNMMKWAAESSVFTLTTIRDSLTWGAGAGLALAGLAGLAGVPITAGMTLTGLAWASLAGAVGTAATIGGTVSVANKTQGTMYRELRNQGVEKNLARSAASINGYVNGYIETALGVVPAGVGAVLKATGVEKLTATTMARLAMRGTWGTLGKMLANHVVDSIGEGEEEFFQSLADDITDAVVLTISDECKANGVKFDKSVGDVIRDAIKAGGQGFGAALIMGVPTTAVNANVSVKEARRLKAEAKLNPSEADFVRHHENDSAFEGVEKKEVKDMLHQMYKAQNEVPVEERIDQTVIDSDIIEENVEIESEEDEEAVASEVPEKDIERMENGRLRTQEEKDYDVDLEGNEKHTLKVGTPNSSTRYGRVEYTINKDGSIEIDKVSTKAGFQKSVTKDAVLELMRRYAGQDVTWNPTNAYQQKIKAELENENGGKLQRFASEYNQSEEAELGDFLHEKYGQFTPTQGKLLYGLYKNIAQHYGQTVHEMIADAKANNPRAALRFRYMTDAVKEGLIDKKQARRRGLIDYANRIIYVGENGDITTLFHEGFHMLSKVDKEGAQELVKAIAESKDMESYFKSHRAFFVPQLGLTVDEIMQELSNLSEDSDKWTENQDEILTSMFEAYLRDGKTLSKKLENIFSRIADFFVQIYRTLAGGNHLNDNIIKAFDKILEGNPELKEKFDQSQREGVRAQDDIRFQDFTPEQIEIANEELKNFSPKDQKRINANFKRLKDTNWYNNAMKALLIRSDMRALMEGREPTANSILMTSGKLEGAREALRQGWSGVYAYLKKNSWLADTAKPEFAVNSSLLFCNPSLACATFCYATEGNFTWPSAMVKAEMVNMAIEHDPVKAGHAIAISYKNTTAFDAGKNLRLLDKGDLSENYLIMIKTANDDGVYFHIFSKRAELAKQIDRTKNLVELSIDNTNIGLARNKDFDELPIAFAYNGTKEDADKIDSLKDRYKKHGGVILPIKDKGKTMPKEQIDLLPDWTKNHQCPVDNGQQPLKIEAEGVEVRNWYCGACDRHLDGKVSCGCYFCREDHVQEMFEKTLNTKDLAEMEEGDIKDGAERLVGLLVKRGTRGLEIQGGTKSVLVHLADILSKTLEGIDPEDPREFSRTASEGLGTRPRKRSNTRFQDEITDTEYLDAVNAGDMTKAQAMVDQRAREQGYNSPKLYHGTQDFGFTTVDVSESDDGMSFFATDSIETARSYSAVGGTRQVGKRTAEDILQVKNDAKARYKEAANRFITLLKEIDPEDFADANIKDITKVNIDKIDKYDAYKYSKFIKELNWRMYDMLNKATEDLKRNSITGNIYHTDEYNTYLDIEADITEALRTLRGENNGRGNYSLYAKTDNLMEIDANGERWNVIELPKTIQNELWGHKGFEKYANPRILEVIKVDTRELAQIAKELGYSGVQIKNVIDNGGVGKGVKTPATVYIFFNPQSQVKSADPVTYDDNGQVIPLSQRFNENPDIRFQQDTPSLDRLLRFQGAFHGSGADFDAFSTDHIGEGEGAQAYGWGLYVSELESIARWYAENNSPMPVTDYYLNGKPVREISMGLDDYIERQNILGDKLDKGTVKDILSVYIKGRRNSQSNRQELADDYAKLIEDIDKDKEQSLNDYLVAHEKSEYYNTIKNAISQIQAQRINSEIRANINDLRALFVDRKEDFEQSSANIKRIIESLEALDPETFEIKSSNPRNLYKVDIPDDTGSNYLYWDKELTKEQIDNIKTLLKTVAENPDNATKKRLINAIGHALDPNFNEWDSFHVNLFRKGRILGESMYKVLEDIFKSPKAASEFLNSLGYVGISYPAASRSGGTRNNDRNYVIFNGDDIKINDHIRFQGAYHGTPHDFEMFDTEHIGEGEGAQVYGWGLYFSELRSVAKWYAERLSPTPNEYNITLNGQPLEKDIDDFIIYNTDWIENSVNANDLQHKIRTVIDNYNYKKKGIPVMEKALELIKEHPDDTGNKHFERVMEILPDEYKPEWDNKLKWLGLDALEGNYKEAIRRAKAWIDKYRVFDGLDADKLEVVQKTKPRNLYTVEIPDDTGNNYLDWSEPPTAEQKQMIANFAHENAGYYDNFNGLSIWDYDHSQNPEHEVILGSDLDGYMEGSDIYNKLIRALGSDKDASLFLSDAGFTGIKYPVGSHSYRKSDTKKNYVIFNSDDIQIKRHLRWQNELTDDERATLVEEAREFKTFDEFLNYMSIMNGWIDPAQYSDALDVLDEIYGEAHGNTREKAKLDIDLSGLTDEEKDRTFEQYIDGDGIKNIIKMLHDMYTTYYGYIYAHGGLEDDEIEEAESLRARIREFEDNASMFIVNLAKSKKELSDKQFNSIRNVIKKNTRMYRELIADTLESETLRSDAEPDIKGTRAEERPTLADRSELEKDAGTSLDDKVEGEIEKKLDQLDKELSDDEKAAEALTRELDSLMGELKGELTPEEQKALKELKFLDRLAHRKDEYAKALKKKIDNGEAISQAENTRLETVAKKIKELEEALAKFNDKQKAKAYLDKQNALKELRADIREKQKQKRALKEMHEYKVKLVKYLQRKVPKSVAYEYKGMIEAIISMFSDVSGYDNNITYRGKSLTPKEFREAVEKDGALDELSKYQLKRYDGKSLADYTVEELERFADVKRRLVNIGRQLWQAKVDARNAEAAQIRQIILNHLRKNPKYTTAPLPDTEEDKKAKKSFRKKFSEIFTRTIPMSRITQMLDGGEKGFIYDLLTRDKRLVQDMERLAVRERINRVQELMDKLGVKKEDFYKPVEMSIRQSDDLGPASEIEKYTDTYTLGQLIYGIMAQRNVRNKYAFMFGDLVTQDEKAILNHDNDFIYDLGMRRNERFVKQAEEILKQYPNIMQVADAIVKDWQDINNKTRLNQVMIDEYNQGLDMEDFYMPIKRLDFNGTSLAQSIADDVFNQNAGKARTTPKKGFTIARFDITPDQQKRTNMDFLELWLNSVDEQEHLIATNAYIRKLNRVFKGRGSEDLRSAIENIYGQHITEDIDNYINDFANPPRAAEDRNVSKWIRFMRGRLYEAYLGFKLSSFVLQVITSPAPFLREVNALQLSNYILKVMANPSKYWKFITERSTMMESRSIDPILAEIKKEKNDFTANQFVRTYHKALAFGTGLLEVADRWMVSAGWLACYEKAMAERQEAINSGDMTQMQAELEASQYADEVVLETQPTGDRSELSPIFKTGSAAWQALTQFTTSLNVIWTNLLYDAKTDLQNRNFKRAIMTAFAYALAGTVLYAVQDYEPPEDDDEWIKDTLLKLIYGMTSQGVSSVPLIGSGLEKLSKQLFTGEKQMMSQRVFPMFETARESLERIAQGKLDEKTVRKAIEAISLGLGLPVSGAKELEHIFRDRSGNLRYRGKRISDNELLDFILKEKWGSVLGRRDNYGHK